MPVHDLAQTAGAQNLESLRSAIPDFAKDIRLNLSSVLKVDPASGLSEGQVLGVALAAAYAAKQNAVIAAVSGAAAAVLTPEEVAAAKAAAAIMAMNNVYYRSVHMLHDEELSSMPAGLRMNVIGNLGIEKITFELYTLAVSAINGCSGCLQAHAKAVTHGDLPKAAVQHVLKIAAVINAAAQVLSL